MSSGLHDHFLFRRRLTLYGLGSVVRADEYVFHAGTQQLGHDPGLGDAAARSVGRIAVKNFRGLAPARVRVGFLKEAAATAWRASAPRRFRRLLSHTPL